MTCLLTLLLPALASCARLPGVEKLVTYPSPVDGSGQTYGVYVPASPTPPGGYPVVLHAHGYGWWVGTGFSDWQKAWADAHGWILVQLNARGPSFYWGIGDVATREVVEDLDRRFGIDRRRVYITGGSMGGTGAFRQGIAHPEMIAAAVGVDGWADFREWHWHWYARKDQRDDIEEFRRPLLEAASPVYIAERANWGDVYVVADAKDDTVYPWQGLDLATRLQALKAERPGAYESGLTFTPDRGHCGTNDLAWIYNYFLARSARPERGAFRIATPILNHGEMYWGRMEAQHFYGEKSLLDCCSSVRDGLGVVDVVTQNLDAFTLHLPLSPVADCPRVEVMVDGFLAHEGPPRELTLEARREADDHVTAWEPLPGPGEADVTPGRDAPPGHAAFRKTPESCGPLGHAFLSPFRVCYGTLGSAEATRLHREEATAFAQGWNDFMVHAPTVQAVPEEDLATWDLERANLVVYGGVDTSHLLQRARALHPLPVEVYSDRVVVHDPLTGDREYRGAKFGAFVVYPNPLTEGRTYLVVCKGRFFSEPEGRSPRGLEFDLEKLEWGYPDYVVFNTDQHDLPHVMNVNDKPPVTCYEAAYFVEAGTFSADWRPDRFATLDRVRRTTPDRVRLIHVAEVAVGPTSRSLPVFIHVNGTPDDPARSDLPQPVLAATVKVVDAGGNPVRQARVTGYWAGLGADALSRPTLSDGVAYFPCPVANPRRASFVVLNVMATGAEYDFEADALPGSGWQSADGSVAFRPASLRQSVDPEAPVSIPFDLVNLAEEPREVRLSFLPPHGVVDAHQTSYRLGAGQQLHGQFSWLPDRARPAGVYQGLLQLTAPGLQLLRPVQLNLAPARRLPVYVVSVAGKDLACSEPYEIRANLHNGDLRDAVTVRVAAGIAGAARRLPTQRLTLGPDESYELVWRQAPGEALLPVGEYQARVWVLDAPGISDAAPFAVRP